MQRSGQVFLPKLILLNPIALYAILAFLSATELKTSLSEHIPKESSNTNRLYPDMSTPYTMPWPILLRTGFLVTRQTLLNAAFSFHHTADTYILGCFSYHKADTS